MSMSAAARLPRLLVLLALLVLQRQHAPAGGAAAFLVAPSAATARSRTATWRPRSTVVVTQSSTADVDASE